MIASDLAIPENTSLAPIAAESNAAWLYIASLSTKKSRVTMIKALARALAVLGSSVHPLKYPWGTLTYASVRVVAPVLRERGYSVATANLSLAALKGVAREAFLNKDLDREEWERIHTIRVVKGEVLLAGRAIAESDVAAMLRQCDGSDPIGIRDAAVLATLWATGMRRAELCALEFPRSLEGKEALRLEGKGNKQRLAYLGEDREYFDAWLEVRGGEEGPLFLSFDPANSGPPRGLAESSVLYIIRKLAARARVQELSPHDLRRTVISEMLDSGVDISTVKGIVGHYSVSVTEKYDRRGEKTKKEAVARRRLPR